MWITVSPKQQEPRTIEVRSGVIVLGRAPDSNLVIDDPHVSSRHARLEVHNGGAWLSDLDSTNGTVVGGRRIQAPVWIDAPGEFSIGGIQVRLALEGAPPAVGPPTERAPTRTFPSSGGAPAPPPATSVADAGPVAGGDVGIRAGRDAAGRDIIHEGFKLRTRMRSSAKNSIRLGIVSFLIGFAAFGYFLVTWNTEIFDLVSDPQRQTFPEDLPSPLPWLPLGAAAMLLGLVLVVTGLLIPRDQVIGRRDN